MLNALKKILKEITVGESDKLTFSPDDERLATAALMFHLVAIDGDVDDLEQKAMRDVLRKSYDIDPEQLELLIREAKKRDEEAIDLYGFTSLLKRKLDIEGRLGVVEMLWEMVYADGIVHEFEDNTVWRVAELLGVSKRERLDIRHRVAARVSPQE
ncbi:MAG: TerB family tellurite resistance protein [Stappiaceae bacterium]